MDVELLHPDPNRGVAPRLAMWLGQASRFELVVAFLTLRGARLLLDNLRADDDHVTIAVSVRFPTNLDALSVLHARWPGRVYLHLGYQTPQEEFADRAQMHSKVAVIADRSGTVRALVGSHNWTATALWGLNGEASLLLEGEDSDPVIADIRSHIRTTVGGCVLFNPAHIDYYLEIQKRLHRGPPEPASDTELEGYIATTVLVLHAEARATDLLAEQELLLYVPLSRQPTLALTVGTMMHLYVYPIGTLLGGVPSATPVFFSGTLQTLNTLETGGIVDRPINSAISDMHRPVIDRTTVVPRVPGVGFEVVANLHARNAAEPFVYHVGNGKPGVHVDVDWEATTGPTNLSDHDASEIERFFRSGLGWRRAAGEVENMKLTIPRAKIVYARDPYLRLAERFGQRRGGEGLRRRAKEASSGDERRRPPWETDYFYLADGWVREDGQ